MNLATVEGRAGYSIITGGLKVPYNTLFMIRCDYCTKGFAESSDGFVQKTFHEILHEAKVVNQ